MNQLNNHCQLEIHAPSSYSLVKTEDLPHDFVLELIDEDTESGRFNFFTLVYYLYNLVDSLSSVWRLTVKPLSY
jgi:hypothetical protein